VRKNPKRFYFFYSLREQSKRLGESNKLIAENKSVNSSLETHHSRYAISEKREKRKVSNEKWGKGDAGGRGCCPLSGRDDNPPRFLTTTPISH